MHRGRRKFFKTSRVEKSRRVSSGRQTESDRGLLRSCPRRLQAKVGHGRIALGSRQDRNHQRVVPGLYCREVRGHPPERKLLEEIHHRFQVLSARCAVVRIINAFAAFPGMPCPVATGAAPSPRLFPPMHRVDVSVSPLPACFIVERRLPVASDIARDALIPVAYGPV